MTSRNRLVLTLWLALATSTCLTAPSLAQKGDASALGAKIMELSRAGKYAEAVPLAQRQLNTAEKAYGPVHRDVAAALNNLGLLYGDQGRDSEAEPLLQARRRHPGKARRAGFFRGDAGVEQSRGAVPARRALRRCRAAIQTRAGDPRTVAFTRSSRRRAVPQQSGDALREAGPPRRFGTIVQAGAGDLRE